MGDVVGFTKEFSYLEALRREALEKAERFYLEEGPVIQVYVGGLRFLVNKQTQKADLVSK